MKTKLRRAQEVGEKAALEAAADPPGGPGKEFAGLDRPEFKRADNPGAPPGAPDQRGPAPGEVGAKGEAEIMGRQDSPSRRRQGGVRA